LELEEFITKCGTEVGDEQIECHVVESGVSTMFYQSGGGVCADGNG
jgi:hypothetical protein